MNENRPDYVQPALLAGAVAGCLSALPFLSLFNCACCLWILGAGAAAVYLMKKNVPGRLSSGDGALAGALAGIIAAVVQTIIGVPFRGMQLEISRRFLQRMSEFTKQMPDGWDTWLKRGSGPLAPAALLLGLLVTAVVFAAFGALGGVLGTALFNRSEPRTPDAPTPPPPTDESHIDAA